MRLMIQYLEPGPHLAAMTPLQARERLHSILARLPVEAVLVGWDLPEALVDVCACEANRAGASLYLWHPLCTAQRAPRGWQAWGAVAADGAPASGHAELPEFTFLCPNHPEARALMFVRLEQALTDERYAGAFLDRIRWPSPTAGLDAHSACFCPQCIEAARRDGIELAEVRQALQTRPPQQSLRSMLAGVADRALDNDPLPVWRCWRAARITALVTEAAARARRLGKAVGLDLWSPALAPLVGQDLAALAALADWVKVMTYGHAWGPAGLPYEIGLLARWLTGKGQVEERRALPYLAHLLGLPLPASQTALRQGMAAEALGLEARRALELKSAPLLAGLEIVELSGVCELNETQVRANVEALRNSGADGLVLSWDLWQMPLERLEWIAPYAG